MLVVVLAAGQAPAATNNDLYTNWQTPGWSGDLFAPPSGVPGGLGHTETSTVFFNNKWYMYHRYWTGGAPGIGYSTSGPTDGHTFTWGGTITPPPAGGYAIAPKVLVQDGLLTMVWEQKDSTCNGCVWMANSTNGTTWTSKRKIITAQQTWEGAGTNPPGNVGTPTITFVKDADPNPLSGLYYVGYHGFGGNATAPNALRRGVATYSGNDPRLITSSTITRWPSPMSFTTTSGGALPAQYAQGIGAADIMRFQAGSGGIDDGGYYMVHEGFQGNVICGNNNGGKVLIAISRADSPSGPWRVQSNVLLGQKVSGSGYSGCGRDMPSWNYVPGGPYRVILTDCTAHPVNGGNWTTGGCDATAGPTTWTIRRIKLDNPYAP